MTDSNFVLENEAARAELSELIARLDERAFAAGTGSGWTIASSLCHLAFWDQRALFLLKAWQSSGRIENLLLSSQSVDSINQAVNTIAKAVPGPAAGELALESASAVDTHLMGISDEFAGRLVSAGLERYLRRSLHRREHLQKIRQALARQPAGRA
jgi:hypothetical protein